MKWYIISTWTGGMEVDIKYGPTTNDVDEGTK